MSQDKFTNLSTLHVEREMSNAVNVEDVLNDFAKSGHRWHCNNAIKLFKLYLNKHTNYLFKLIMLSIFLLFIHSF